MIYLSIYQSPKNAPTPEDVSLNDISPLDNEDDDEKVPLDDGEVELAADDDVDLDAGEAAGNGDLDSLFGVECSTPTPEPKRRRVRRVRETGDAVSFIVMLYLNTQIDKL